MHCGRERREVEERKGEKGVFEFPLLKFSAFTDAYSSLSSE